MKIVPTSLLVAFLLSSTSIAQSPKRQDTDKRVLEDSRPAQQEPPKKVPMEKIEIFQITTADAKPDSETKLRITQWLVGKNVLDFQAVPCQGSVLLIYHYSETR